MRFQNLAIVFFISELLEAKNKMKTVSFVIVTWNSENHIKDCLASVKSLSYPLKEIIIADNGSSDKTLSVIKENFPEVKILTFPHNPGFGFACNRGAEISKGDILFFLNPDTKILSDELSKAVDFVSSNEKSVLGFKLLWENGKFQDSYARFFSVFHSVLELFEFHYYFGKNPFNRYVNYDFKVFDKIAEVDWVVGAAFMIGKDFFKNIGGFDEKFFMYFEENDLCRRARKEGGKVFFFPYMEVIHYRGASADKKGSRKLEYYQSMCYYHRKYGGVLSEMIIRISIILSSLIYLFAYFVKYITGRKNDISKKVSVKIKLIRWVLGL